MRGKELRVAIYLVSEERLAAMNALMDSAGLASASELVRRLIDQEQRREETRVRRRARRITDRR